MRDIQGDTGKMKPTDYFVVKSCEDGNEWLPDLKRWI